MKEEANHILLHNKLRRTAVRSKVLTLFLEKEKALSNKELENELGMVDRITLYRTLRTFQEKGIIHEAYDGTETTKYALCKHDCDEHHHVDNHAHFHCVKCEKTFCLEDINTPNIKALGGHHVESSHLFLRGRCASCTPSNK